jgi:hypothetical protein
LPGALARQPPLTRRSGAAAAAAERPSARDYWEALGDALPAALGDALAGALGGAVAALAAGDEGAGELVVVGPLPPSRNHQTNRMIRIAATTATIAFVRFWDR